MIKHICLCGYIYNPKYGDVDGDIEPGVKFDELPNDWECPLCGSKKSSFSAVNKRMRSSFVSLK